MNQRLVEEKLHPSCDKPFEVYHVSFNRMSRNLKKTAYIIR